MGSRLDSTGEALRSPFPWVALSAALALTAAGWFTLQRSRHEDAHVLFERRTEAAVTGLRARVIAYEQALRASAAHVASSPEITRDDWHRYVGHLRVSERFPGIVCMGYARLTAGEAGTVQAPVVFNDPSRKPRGAMEGFDLYRDDVRRQALDLARESGESAITARLGVPREDARDANDVVPGFMMVVPVYRALPDGLPRQDRAIQGYVFGAFAMEDLVRASVGDALQLLDLRVYDEAAAQGQAQMVDTRSAKPVGSEAVDAAFQRLVHFPMPGHNWTLQFLSLPHVDRALKAQRPWAELTGGLVASLLVFILVTALMEAWNRTHNLSMRDPLTGLYNRRYLEETMAREVPRAARHGVPVGLIVLDLDHFKRLNDSHGHDAGDFVLSRFADLLRHATRGEDIACRFGGEEFGVVLPGASLEIARRRADAIRAAFHDLAFDFEGAPLGTFTVSAGVAVLTPDRQDWAAVLRDADRALYAAKQAGRNRVFSTADL